MNDIIKRLNQAIDIEYDSKNAEVDEVKKMPLNDRVVKGDTIANVTAKFLPLFTQGSEIDFMEVIVQCDDNLSKFREGSPVLLHGHGYSFELNVIKDKGTVMRLQSGFRPFSLPKSFAESNGWQIDNAKVDIRNIVKKSTHILANDSLKRSYISGIFDGSIRPKFNAQRENIARGLVQKTNLNATQKEAFAKAYSTENYYLIQGPPGSGKTWLLAHLAEAFAKEGNKVLITASTHTAINNALQKTSSLTNSSPVIKVGKSYQKENLNYNGSTAVNTSDFRSSGYDNNSRGIIVGATCYSPHTRKLEFMEWDVVIIDEAAQLSIPLAVAAMVKGKKFIFIGDHQQLPPIISEKQKDPVFSGSVFELLFRHSPGIMLDVTYRMNRDINRFPSRQFYQGRLQPHPNNASWTLNLNRPPQKHSDLLNPNKPELLFCHHHYSSNTRSDYEASLAVELVDELLLCGVSPDEIAIITPFRAQVRLIGNALAQLDHPEEVKEKIFVDTIERIQGQERDVVIYSLATSNPSTAKQRAEFFFNPNRLNVALTRARKKRIVLANKELFSLSPEEGNLKALVRVFHDFYEDACKVEERVLGEDLF